MKEWGVNTTNGLFELNLDFFKKIKVNQIRKIGDTPVLLFLSTDSGTISILEKDWKEIQLELRDSKISKLINKKAD